jgi:hypothetical protein
MKSSGESAGQNPDRELEFHDWSGMADPPVNLSVEAAFRRIEEYASWYRRLHGPASLKPSDCCDVEFVL